VCKVDFQPLSMEYRALLVELTTFWMDCGVVLLLGGADRAPVQET